MNLSNVATFRMERPGLRDAFVLLGNKSKQYLYYTRLYFIHWEAGGEIMKLFVSLSGRNYSEIPLKKGNGCDV